MLGSYGKAALCKQYRGLFLNSPSPKMYNMFIITIPIHLHAWRLISAGSTGSLTCQSSAHLAIATLAAASSLLRGIGLPSGTPTCTLPPDSARVCDLRSANNHATLETPKLANACPSCRSGFRRLQMLVELLQGRRQALKRGRRFETLPRLLRGTLELHTRRRQVPALGAN